MGYVGYERGRNLEASQEDRGVIYWNRSHMSGLPGGQRGHLLGEKQGGGGTWAWGGAHWTWVTCETAKRRSQEGRLATPRVLGRDAHSEASATGAKWSCGWCDSRRSRGPRRELCAPTTRAVDGQELQSSQLRGQEERQESMVLLKIWKELCFRKEGLDSCAECC